MARKLVATQDNTSTSSQTEPLSRAVARPIFGESVLAIDYNFADKDYLDDDITFSRASNATYVGSDGYIKTAGNNVARFDYDKDSNSKGLLIEEARTNLIPYSENFAHADWVKTNTTIATSGETDPSGGTGAYKMVSDNATEQQYIYDNMSFTSGSNYTISVYVKPSGNDFVRLGLGGGAFGGNTRAFFNLATGQVATTKAQVISAGIEECGNGWFRIHATALATVTASTQAYIFLASADDTDNNTGDGQSGTILFGSQVEQGSFPTSLIPTTGASASRSGDVAKVDGTAFSRFYKQGTGGAWLVDSTEMGEDRTAQTSPFAVYESSSSKLRVGPKVGGGATNTIAAYYQDGGDMIYSAGSSLGTVTKGVKSKIGITFQTNDGAFTRDGKNPNTDTSIANIYSPTELRLGDNGSGTTNFCGHIARLRYYNKRISNNKLKKETDTPFLLNKYPRAKAAHSLRALMDDSANSPCARIRRSSDNAEADFTPSEITDGTLTTWIGNNNGFINSLYDQTGNNCHATQATAAYQPQLVSGGDLIKSGNHPALEFTQTSPSYSNLEIHGVNAARADSWFVTDTSSTQHIYPSQHDNGSRHGWIAQDGDSNVQAHLGYGGEPVRLYANGTLIGGYDITRDDVHTALNGRKLVHHQDGDTTDWTITQFGWYGQGNAVSSHIPWNYEGKMSEMIWYDSDQSSNRTGIESNINTHYNIY